MNFFGMGPMEIGVILVIALIIFGPGKLPEIGAAVGKGIRDFRAATRDLTSEFERTINEMEEVTAEVKDSAREVQQSTAAALSDVRLDQAPSSATRPARPLPNSPVAAQQPAAAVPRMPTKADPLADLMPLEPTDTVHANGNPSSDPAKPQA